MRFYYIIFLLSGIIISKNVKSQNSILTDAKVKIECINCNSSSLSPTFQIYFEAKFDAGSNVPTDGRFNPNSDTTNYEEFYIKDSVISDCEKIYIYGPIFYTCESIGEYRLGIDLDKNVLFYQKDIADSVFIFNFQIFRPLKTLLSNNAPEVSFLPSRICKFKRDISYCFLEKNSNAFFPMFKLFHNFGDSGSVVFESDTLPIITFKGNSFVNENQSIIVETKGQLESLAGVIHSAKSFHSFVVDTITKPLDFLKLSDSSFVSNFEDEIIVDTGVSIVSLPYKLKLEGYDTSNVQLNFHLNNCPELNVKNMVNEILNDTLYGYLQFEVCKNGKQNLSYLTCKITNKINCCMIYANSWLVKLKSGVSGSNEIESNFYCYLFPNPANKTLSISNASKEINNIRIIDMNGKLFQDLNGDQNEINISDLNSGMYWVEITSKNNEVYRSKFVKLE